MSLTTEEIETLLMPHFRRYAKANRAAILVADEGDLKDASLVVNDFFDWVLRGELEDYIRDNLSLHGAMETTWNNLIAIAREDEVLDEE